MEFNTFNYKINEELQSSRNNSPLNKEIYSDNSISGNNEFLFFIKPEITIDDPGIDLNGILNLIFDKISEFKLAIKNIRVINAPYLKKHNIIAQHYGVINQLSDNLKDNISEEATNRFEEVYNIKFSEAEILGSLEFIKAYPEFTATGLSYLWQNSPTEKLAGGTYSQKLTIDGKDVYLVNGFHPRQLEHFIADKRSIITMTLVGNTSWKDARNAFIGKTNPIDAQEGSIRNELLKNKDKFGLKEISSTWNGVHLSAGPIEGLIELMRYNSDFETGKINSEKDYIFGAELAKKLDASTLENVLNNKTVVYNKKNISYFDLTEEMDSDRCIEIIEEVK